MKNLILVAAIALAGCASQPETYWAKAGATDSDFDIDKGQCDAQAFQVAGGSLMQIALVQNGCMRGKGWRLQER